MPHFKIANGLQTVEGRYLSNVSLYYQTWGDPNGEVVWICHALTGDTSVESWWPTLFKSNGGWLDPAVHFLVCANSLGSCYGSSFEYEGEQLQLHHRDAVYAFDQLRSHLGITKLKWLIGGSMGGQQALEWSLFRPALIQNLVLIGTNAKQSAWGKAWNHVQRQAINSAGDGAGLALARQIAMISYRTFEDFQEKENHTLNEKGDTLSYLNYQGEKFLERFDQQAYLQLIGMMDVHDISYARGASVASILQTIKVDTIVIELAGDVLFPEEEQRVLYQHIPSASHYKIDTSKGHDGFLLEGKTISRIIEAAEQKNLILR